MDPSPVAGHDEEPPVGAIDEGVGELLRQGRGGQGLGGDVAGGGLDGGVRRLGEGSAGAKREPQHRRRDQARRAHQAASNFRGAPQNVDTSDVASAGAAVVRNRRAPLVPTSYSGWAAK